MTKKIVWRLTTPPTAMDIVELVNNQIITKDEAKEMLIRTEDEAK